MAAQTIPTITGISRDLRRSRSYRVRLIRNNQRIEVGRFATLAEAQAAAMEARQLLPAPIPQRKGNQYTNIDATERFWLYAQPSEGCWG